MEFGVVFDQEERKAAEENMLERKRAGEDMKVVDFQEVVAA